MKFPRNARIFRGRLDAAPFASVFFLLMIFLMLSSLVYTGGVQIDLPAAKDMPGTDQPTIQVAMDKYGALYFKNKKVDEAELQDAMRTASKQLGGTVTLVVQADKAVSYDRLLKLVLLASDAGIKHALLATLPEALAAPTAEAGL